MTWKCEIIIESSNGTTFVLRSRRIKFVETTKYLQMGSNKRTKIMHMTYKFDGRYAIIFWWWADSFSFSVRHADRHWLVSTQIPLNLARAAQNIVSKHFSSYGINVWNLTMIDKNSLWFYCKCDNVYEIQANCLHLILHIFLASQCKSASHEYESMFVVLHFRLPWATRTRSIFICEIPFGTKNCTTFVKLGIRIKRLLAYFS